MNILLISKELNALNSYRMRVNPYNIVIMRNRRIFLARYNQVRIMGFLLVCINIQFLINGIKNLVLDIGSGRNCKNKLYKDAKFYP